jgi:hypothetical protein
MKKVLLLFCALVVLNACTNEYEQSTISPDIDDEYQLSESFVPFEQAIGNADFLFRNIEKERKRKIQDVRVIKTSDISGVTRSSNEEEPLAYVVNYQNNDGYVILSATTELPPIIAIGDNGNFSLDQFVDYMSGNTTRSDGNSLCPEQEFQYEIINNSLNLRKSNIVIGPILPPRNTRDTTIVLKCMPLIPVKWGQGDPYNRYCYNEENELCPAGCVPVACAQTLASLCYHHNHRPSNQIDASYPVDWYVINKLIVADTIRYSSGMDTPGVRNIANLVRGIGAKANATYTTSGTSVTDNNIHRVIDMYEECGLQNVNLVTNDDPNVVNYLFSNIVNNNYPVDCYARRLKEDGTTTGHCFNADGWLRLQYTQSIIDNITVDGTTIYRDDYKQYSFDLLHINFGWNGAADGYYLPGAFDLTSDEFGGYREDEDIDVDMDRNYNLRVRYMFYEL